jgi:hypothetical protein
MEKCHDIRRYFTQKVNLLEEACINDEEEISQRVWKALDLACMNALDTFYNRRDLCILDSVALHARHEATNAWGKMSP